MTQPAGEAQAQQAVNTNTNLFQQFSATGLPIMQGSEAYSTGRLGQIAAGSGLPSYVQAGYGAAKAGAFDSMIDQANQGRAMARGPAAVRAYTPSFAGGAAELAREKAGINVSSSLAGINERNSMLRAAAGGAASSTNLAAGFGRLAIQGIAGEARAGNPGYAASQGILSAALGAYGYATTANNRSALLRNTPGDYGTGQSNYGSYGDTVPANTNPSGAGAPTFD